MLGTNHPDPTNMCGGSEDGEDLRGPTKAQQRERKFMTVAGQNRKGKGWGEQLETVNLAGAESVGQVKLTRWRLHCERLVKKEARRTLERGKPKRN